MQESRNKEQSTHGEPYLDREALIDLSLAASDDEENFNRQAVLGMAKRMAKKEGG